MRDQMRVAGKFGDKAAKCLARTEARVGESDAAIDHLRQLLDAPAGSVVAVPILRIDPAWNPLRKDPRFQKLITDGGAAGQSPMP